jgi:hypothetical protein
MIALQSLIGGVEVKELWTSEVEQARRVAEPVLESEYARAGTPVPALYIVEKLSSGDRHTADARFRGGLEFACRSLLHSSSARTR